MPLQKVKLHIGCGEATSGQPVGPIMGQIQINITDFVAKFNTLSTARFEKGIPLATVVRRNPKDKSYTIQIKGPSLLSILDNVTGLARGREYLSVTQAYDILLIKARLMADSGLSSEAIARSLFGTLHSAKIGLQLTDEVGDDFDETFDA